MVHEIEFLSMYLKGNSIIVVPPCTPQAP